MRGDLGGCAESQIIVSARKGFMVQWGGLRSLDDRTETIGSIYGMLLFITRPKYSRTYRKTIIILVVAGLSVRSQGCHGAHTGELPIVVKFYDGE